MPTDSKPLALLLVDHWRAIFFGTAFFVLAALVFGIFLPKGYRSRCLILVNPSKAAASLKLAPEPLHMTTVHSLANSDFVLQRTLTLLRDQRVAVEQAIEAQEGPDDWGDVRQLDAHRASVLLGREGEPGFLKLWEDLPPAYLLPALNALDLDYLGSLDPILFKKHLSSRIQTTVETMHAVEYQPVLQFEAEWDSAPVAALVAYAWAKALIRTLREQHLDPTLELQALVQDRFASVNRTIDRINRQIENVRVEAEVRRLFSEKETGMVALYGALERVAHMEILPASRELARREPLISFTERLFDEVSRIRMVMGAPSSLMTERAALRREMGTVGEAGASRDGVESALAGFDTTLESTARELEGKHRTLFMAENEIAKLRMERRIEEKKRAYLIKTGAFEALNVNYEEMWGIRLMTPPTPPRTHSSPILWKIALWGGLVGLAFNLFLVFMSVSLLRIPPERWDEE